MKTIVLSADMRATQEITVEEALVKLLLGKAYSLEDYNGVVFRSRCLSVPAPRVIVTVRYVKLPEQYAAPLNNANLFARDAHTCQYCGRRASDFVRGERLTRDHIVPVSRGGPDSWENCVTACSKCNNKKADKLPGEAGMRLRTVPATVTRWGLSDIKMARFERRGGRSRVMDRVA
jgi:5-methylcytosine-specific restriction endonuclease McrA